MRRTENTETVMVNDDVEQIVDPQFWGISKPVFSYRVSNENHTYLVACENDDANEAWIRAGYLNDAVIERVCEQSLGGHGDMYREWVAQGLIG